MKRRIAYALVACSLVVVIITILFGRDIVEMVVVFHQWDKQMDTGKKYMDSLTDKDIPVWIERTKKYLNGYDLNSNGIISIPPDLQKLKIVRIDAIGERVYYVWMGGMDHTDLEVERMSDGSFRFTAQYNDESSRVIWPKQ